MAGTGWDSADLLRRFNALAGRPPADAVTDAQKYGYLADAQDFVLTQIEGIVPRVLYGPPVQLVTADGGYTFTFGLDGDGYALFPSGKAGIFPSLDAIPSYPWVPGVDYLDEGTRIRMPNQTAWQGRLYWYGITPPQEISATVQPMLQPPASRILIVIEAVRQFAESYARNPDLASMMDRQWARTFGPQMTAIRTHFRGSQQGVSGGWGLGFFKGIGSGWNGRSWW